MSGDSVLGTPYLAENTKQRSERKTKLDLVEKVLIAKSFATKGSMTKKFTVRGQKPQHIQVLLPSAKCLRVLRLLIRSPGDAMLGVVIYGADMF